MADDSRAQKVDPSLVAEIVQSYVRQNSIGVDQIGGLIATVHRTLSGLGANAPMSATETLTPAVPIRRSVQPDHVVCLEMRVSRQDATPASPRRSWAGTSGVSRPLEVGGWSPNHRASLFGAAFDNAKAGRPRKSAGSRRVDVGSRSGGAAGSGSHRPARAAPWPQTTIGSRGVARTRRRTRRGPRLSTACAPWPRDFSRSVIVME